MHPAISFQIGPGFQKCLRSDATRYRVHATCPQHLTALCTVLYYTVTPKPLTLRETEELVILLFIRFPYYSFSAKSQRPILIMKAPIWEFPKIRGTLFGGPYNKEPTI